MVFTIRGTIHGICASTIMLAFCMSGSCHSLPPAPVIENEREFFDPRTLSWQPTEELSPIQGKWYQDNKLFLAFNDDSLLIDKWVISTWDAEQADSTYRLIYEAGSQYHVLYIRPDQQDTIRILPADTSFSNPEYADSVIATGDWTYLSGSIPWQTIEPSDVILGNWHIRDGVFEIQVGPQQALLDGEAWTIDAFQSISDFHRLLLSRTDSTISVYFHHTTPLFPQVKIWGSTEDIFDQNGTIPGKWTVVVRWYDFLEASGFVDGKTYGYRYTLQSIRVEAQNQSTSIRDSLAEIHSLNGKMDITVSGAISADGDGELDLSVKHAILHDEGTVYLSRRENSLKDVLQDSSWIGPGKIIEINYKLVMENDTLWTLNDQGKTFFVSRKIDHRSIIDLGMFAFPFDPPLDIFPEPTALNGEVTLLDESGSLPEVLPYNGQRIIEDINGVSTILVGMQRHSYAGISPNGGIIQIQYLFGKYDRLLWSPNRGGNANTNYHETLFTCELNSR